MQSYSNSFSSSPNSSSSIPSIKMANPNMLAKGENNYSDLTDQELNPHMQYIERPPMMQPLEPWMTTSHAPPSTQPSQYYNVNEAPSFLPTPPGSSHPRQPQQSRMPMENNFASHEFMANGSNVQINYQQQQQQPHQQQQQQQQHQQQQVHPHQTYSPSPSPPRYRQGSIASDSSNPSSTPYGDLEEQSSQSGRNHAGGSGSGSTKTTVNKRDKALERNRQAALRCRQRKKEWLNQLQSNVDVLTKENRALEQQSLTLREEILNLKTVLLAHRDCSHAHLTANSINFDKLLYRSSSSNNTSTASAPNTTAI